MSGNAARQSWYSAVEETAGLLGLDCSREKLWPVLAAFQEDLTVSPIVLNTVAGRTLSFDFTTPESGGDPYERALAHGLAKETDHSIRALFPDVRAHLPVHSYGVDYGVTSGFNKSYVLFPMTERQHLEALADVPAMPKGLAANMSSFIRYGLDGKISALAVDYANRTWNLYFNGLSADQVERATLQSMLREFGLPEPSEQLLDFAQGSAAFYPSFGWDSETIERVSFSTRTTVPMDLPACVEPSLDKFARNAPYTYPGERVLVYAGAYGHTQEYYKLAIYHQITSPAQDRVRSAD